MRLRDWLCNASSGAEIEFSVGRGASRRACEVGFLGGDRASGVRSCDLEQRRRHGGVQVPQGECIRNPRFKCGLLCNRSVMPAAMKRVTGFQFLVAFARNFCALDCGE